MSKAKFALGAIIGAVAGIVAGVLTAPKSGKETRADIKEKAAELKQQANLRVDSAKTKSGEVAAELQDKAEEYKKRGERAVQDIKRDFSERK
jgi:gas vesicle protein